MSPRYNGLYSKLQGGPKNVSEWVEFNAPLDTIQVISEARGYTLAVLYISYSVVDDQRHK